MLLLWLFPPLFISALYLATSARGMRWSSLDLSKSLSKGAIWLRLAVVPGSTFSSLYSLLKGLSNCATRSGCCSKSSTQTVSYVKWEMRQGCNGTENLVKNLTANLQWIRCLIKSDHFIRDPQNILKHINLAHQSLFPPLKN